MKSETQCPDDEWDVKMFPGFDALHIAKIKMCEIFGVINISRWIVQADIYIYAKGHDLRVECVLAG